MHKWQLLKTIRLTLIIVPTLAIANITTISCSTTTKIEITIESGNLYEAGHEIVIKANVHQAKGSIEWIYQLLAGVSVDSNITNSNKIGFKLDSNIQETSFYVFAKNNNQESNKINIPVSYDPFSFIDDRTFAIERYYNEQNWAKGTGWIINRADVESNKYSYWLATNWHVKDGFDHVIGGTYGYADKSVSIGNFLTYEVFTFNAESWQNFTINNDKGNAIDFYVAKVNFGSPTGGYKSKLDKLNSYWGSHNHHINEFVTNYESTTSSNPKYIGGYPASGSNKYAVWESQTIINSTNTSIGTHACDEAESVTDASPQYRFLPNVTNGWMGPGASGSMILDNQFRICGIYWGGWGWEGTNDFSPCASIFNSSAKNFIAPYI